MKRLEVEMKTKNRFIKNEEYFMLKDKRLVRGEFLTVQDPGGGTKNKRNI